MTPSSAITIIIPHHSGDVLSSCLRMLYAHTPDHLSDVIVIDDSVTDDGSIQRALAHFPRIRILKTTGEAGFGASCNLGLRHSKGKYAVLLNNDVEVTPGWLSPMVKAMESDPGLGICQPKILSLRDRRTFDAGGGAGGMMDIFGYPFALGSVVHTVEADNRQYDTPRELFWAHGSAMVLRISMFEDIGFFDEDFYMQAEEIDLCCRALRNNYRIQSVPSSIVYHYFGWTLKTESVKRFYLSHRNTMIVLLKNWPGSWLMWVFPVRILLELLTIVYGFFCRWDWKQPLGVAMALTWVCFHPKTIVQRRNRVHRNGIDDRTAFSEHIYRGSIIWEYFIRRKKTCDEMLSMAK